MKKHELYMRYSADRNMVMKNMSAKLLSSAIVTADGSVRWTPAISPYSYTWHDRCRTSVFTLVPEPKGALAMAVGACAMVLSLARRRDTPRL